MRGWGIGTSQGLCVVLYCSSAARHVPPGNATPATIHLAQCPAVNHRYPPPNPNRNRCPAARCRGRGSWEPHQLWRRPRCRMAPAGTTTADAGAERLPATAPAALPSSRRSSGATNTATFVVEDDPDYVSPYGDDSAAHALYSALVTLALGVLGRCGPARPTQATVRRRLKGGLPCCCRWWWRAPLAGWRSPGMVHWLPPSVIGHGARHARVVGGLPCVAVAAVVSGPGGGGRGGRQSLLCLGWYRLVRGRGTALGWVAVWGGGRLRQRRNLQWVGGKVAGPPPTHPAPSHARHRPFLCAPLPSPQTHAHIYRTTLPPPPCTPSIPPTPTPAPAPTPQRVPATLPLPPNVGHFICLPAQHGAACALCLLKGGRRVCVFWGVWGRVGCRDACMPSAATHPRMCNGPVSWPRHCPGDAPAAAAPTAAALLQALCHHHPHPNPHPYPQHARAHTHTRAGWLALASAAALLGLGLAWALPASAIPAHPDTCASLPPPPAPAPADRHRRRRADHGARGLCERPHVLHAGAGGRLLGPLVVRGAGRVGGRRQGQGGPVGQ